MISTTNKQLSKIVSHPVLFSYFISNPTEIFQHAFRCRRRTVISRLTNNVITLPEGLGTHVSTLDHLISKVYGDAERMDDPLYIGQRTILCTTNVHVDSINDLMINRCRGISKTYLSVDTVRNSDYELTYSTEFLNSLNISGMPPHKLTFKEGEGGGKGKG